MFGFGRTEQVVPLLYKDGTLQFSCSSKYKVGKTAKVKLTLIFGESIHTPTVSMAVTQFEPTEDGTFICTGVLDLSQSKLAELEMQMAYSGVPGADRRASRRLPYTTRILSKELSSFRAVTTNINLNGVELNCDNPVANGHLMNLQLDLESVGFRELRMQARCIWSIEEVDEASRRPRYRVGVEFLNPGADAQAAWGKFYRGILAAEGQSVMLKTMDGSSVPDKGKELVDAATAAAAQAAPPPPPPPPNEPPSASSSGRWTPPTGNPFATQQMPALPAQPAGGFGFPPPQQPSAGLKLATPQAAVPSPNQMGGGFNTQSAPPPPMVPNKLSLPPAAPPQQRQAPGGGLRLPEASTPAAGGFGFPAQQQQPGGYGASPGGGGFGSPQQPPSPGFPTASSSGGFSIPPAGGGYGAPSTPSGPSVGGFQLPPSTPQQGGGGFGFPSSGPASGFQMPAQPAAPQGGGYGFPPPSNPAPGFQMPPQAPAAQSQGFGFPPPASPGSSGGFNVPSQRGGLQLPAQQPAQQSGYGYPPAGGGFSPGQPAGGFPGQPGGYSSGGYSPPSQPASGGFQLPPPPAQPQSGGFGFPPAQPAAGGYAMPPSQPTQPAGGGFAFPQQPAGPEPVAALGIQGSNLAFRCRYDASYQPGARKQVQLTLNVGGRASQVSINVGISRVEPAPDGSAVCWCTVLEDEQKIAVLNQVLGAR